MQIIDPQPNHLSFSNIPMSLLRTFSMMLGELDFVGTYVNTYYRDQLKVPMTSFLILSKTNWRTLSQYAYLYN